MVRKLITTLALGAFAVISTGSTASAQDCTLVKPGVDNPVVQACKKGGIKQAKTVMKTMVAKAKKNGMKVDCDNCHESTETFKLTGDAEKLFKDLMAKQ
jgi:hypothetical protein